MKTGARHIDLLDHLRGVAILAVLVFHALGMAFGYDALPWKGWFRDFSGSAWFLGFLPVALFAQAGVAIFFVVSGFCIHFSFHTQGKVWPGFFIRRLFRIYPPYLMALLLSLAILAINPGLDFFSRDFWWQLLSHLLLIHNFDGATISGINAAWWSLAIEAQLYLLYPLLLWLTRRIGWRRALAVLAVGEVLIRGGDGFAQTMDATGTVAGQVFARLADSPLGYWFSWALGAFLAEAWLKAEPLPLAKASPWLWLGLALGCYFARPLQVFQFLLFAVTTAVVTGRSLSGGSLGLGGPSVPRRVLRRIGLWSYSLYLLHQPLLHVYSHLIVWAVPMEYRPAPVGFLLVMVTWLAIIPLGALWHQVIELPGIALGKRLLGSGFAGTASAATGARLEPRRPGAAGQGLRVAALLAGLAATLLVSYQFSVRAAANRCHRAWVLATSVDASRRNGPLAVKLAEDACLQTQYRQPAMIATLSAAYAEAGRFDEAIGAAQMAGRMASGSGDEKLLRQCQELLQAYQHHEPFREPAGRGLP